MYPSNLKFYQFAIIFILLLITMFLSLSSDCANAQTVFYDDAESYAVNTEPEGWVILDNFLYVSNMNWALSGNEFRSARFSKAKHLLGEQVTNGTATIKVYIEKNCFPVKES